MEHLKSTCATTGICRDINCDEAVKQAPTGRFFITMGHPGFNSRLNNLSGYDSKAQAERIIRDLVRGSRRINA